MVGSGHYFAVILFFASNAFASSAASFAPYHSPEAWPERFGILSKAQSQAPLAAGEQPDWDQLLDKDSAGIQFGAVLEGLFPFTRNPSLAFKPASVTKVFTAAAAIGLLGSEYRFESRLEWNQIASSDPSIITRLRIVGSGDPSWGMIEFGENHLTRIQQLADQLIQDGVREIRGPIEFSYTDARWSNTDRPSGWLADDRLKCFAAMPQGFTIQGNCATVILENTKRAHWDEIGVPDLIQLQVKSGPVTQIEVSETEKGFLISGTWRRGTTPFPIYLPVRRPDIWVINMLTQTLSDRGVRLTADAEKVFDPTSRRISIYSPKMSELIKPMLKMSINFVADALFKTLGDKLGRDSAPDLFKEGETVVREHLSNPAIHLIDGSGLSIDNFLTAQATITFLRDLTKRSFFAEIWDSLPIAGVDGTLRRRMNDSAAQNVLRAKTGTLTGTANLAGYVPRTKNDGTVEYVPFVILTDSPSDQRAQARLAQDRVGIALVESLSSAAQIAP